MSSTARILVVDDEKNITIVLKAMLEKKGYQVFTFTDPKEALSSMSSLDIDVVVTDLYMPELDGMSVLREVNHYWPTVPVVMITAFGTVDSAVDAIKEGAFDYVTKPFEQTEILNSVEKAVNTKRLSLLELIPGGYLAEEAEEQILSPILRSQSPNLSGLESLIQRILNTPSSILICGEAGTGKEILVDDIHRSSRRSQEALIKVNCAAISSFDLEAELFGSSKIGRIELANKGTLFIDEIHRMSPENQTRLLNVLEQGFFERDHNAERVKIDIRLIAASDQDLKKEVEAGRFREDLFYKLNVVQIMLPPLRERSSDLPFLVDYFIRFINNKLGTNILSMDASCIELFQSYQWPGNLRQLENVIERMTLLADGDTLDEDSMPDSVKAELGGVLDFAPTKLRDLVKRQTQALEKGLIERAMQEMNGNITKTADRLGLSRKGLQLKIKELDIRP